LKIVYWKNALAAAEKESCVKGATTAMVMEYADIPAVRVVWFILEVLMEDLNDAAA